MLTNGKACKRAFWRVSSEDLNQAVHLRSLIRNFVSFTSYNKYSIRLGKCEGTFLK